MSASQSWEPLAITRGTAIEHPHEGEYAECGLNARFAAIGWTLEEFKSTSSFASPPPRSATT